MSGGRIRPGDTWRVRAGHLVLSPEDPRGMPLGTPADRRWLWKIERALSASAGNDELKQLAADLYCYLCETCQHHDLPSKGDEMVGPHRQCMWCGVVAFEGESASQVARVILGEPQEGAGTP